MRHQIITKTALLAVAMLLAFSLVSQSNPSFVKKNVKSGQIYEFTLNSINETPVPVSFDQLEYTTLGFYESSENTWVMEVEIVQGLEKDVELIVEYQDYGDIPGLTFPFYTTYKFRSKQTEVNSLMDAFVVDGGQGVVFPLDNDSSSDYNLELSNIVFTQNCTAEIVSDESIEVQVIDADQFAFVEYVATDQVGVSSSASIMLRASDSSIDVYSLQTDDKSNLILVVEEGHLPNQDPIGGTLEEINANCWEYAPNLGFSGEESITFSNGSGNDISYNINVHENPNTVQYVKDDEVYVATNGSITFNVLDNDIFDSLAIVDYSSQLTYLGSGEFSYTPETDFTGDLIFYYTVFQGVSFSTADIVIHVDEFEPYHSSGYLFNAFVGQDLVIHHNTPMVDYTFELISAPLFGDVQILDTNDELVLECATITGENKIIYSPNSAGDDFLEIEYCTDAGSCEIIKLDFNNVAMSTDDCLCVEDCVYSGDVNNDGKVDVQDAVALGLSLGETGPSRDDLDGFVPQSGDSWVYTQDINGLDLGFADANGDGLVAASDLEEVDSYYGGVHNLLPQISYEIIESPIVLEPHQTEVDSGELLVIDILLGSETLPVFDVSGLSFSYTINGDLIDSSSVQLTFLENSWLSYGAPAFEYVNQPIGGRIEAGFSRVSAKGASGGGPIATLEFIVEDDIIGFKLEELLFKMNMSTSEGIIVSEEGRQFSLPRFDTSVDLNLASNTLHPDSYVSILPNPASDFVYITSDKFEIDRVEMYTIDGIKVLDNRYNNEFSLAVELDQLLPGTYILVVSSNDKVSREKLIKI